MFEALVANHMLKETLAGMINRQRLSHSILLQGEAGTGKRTLAGMIAQAVMCEGEGKRPCGTCSACYKVQKGIHPDVITVGADSLRPQSFHIGAVREMRTQVFVAPNEGKRKIYILHNAQNMTVQAQNALLKILEEPPEHAMFILLCENRSSLLETILSRCTIFTLHPPDEETCAQYLRAQKPGLEEQQYLSAAWEAGGNIGRALQILESDGGSQAWENSQALLSAICAGDEFRLLAALSKYEKQKEQFAQLLPCLRQLVKEVTLEKYRRSEADSGQNPAVKSAAAKLSALQSVKILGIIDVTAQRLRQNVNYNLVLASFCAQLRGMK